MCLAIPGRVVEIGADELRTATVSFGGARKAVSLALVPEAAVGDYVIVHAGFAIGRLDEAAAKQTLDTLSALGDRQSAPTARHSGARSSPRTFFIRGRDPGPNPGPRRAPG